MLDPEAPRLAVRMGPTTGVVRHDVHVPDERRGVTLFDTPGLPAGSNKTARARALTALLNMIEQRLARVLDEEAKVVRKKSDGGELVHLSEWSFWVRGGREWDRLSGGREYGCSKLLDCGHHCFTFTPDS